MQDDTYPCAMQLCAVVHQLIEAIGTDAIAVETADNRKALATASSLLLSVRKLFRREQGLTAVETRWALRTIRGVCLYLAGLGLVFWGTAVGDSALRRICDILFIARECASRVLCDEHSFSEDAHAHVEERDVADYARCLALERKIQSVKGGAVATAVLGRATQHLAALREHFPELVEQALAEGGPENANLQCKLLYMASEGLDERGAEDCGHRGPVLWHVLRVCRVIALTILPRANGVAPRRDVSVDAAVAAITAEALYNKVDIRQLVHDVVASNTSTPQALPDI